MGEEDLFSAKIKLTLVRMMAGAETERKPAIKTKRAFLFFV
jgi:hypothetical protein